MTSPYEDLVGQALTLYQKWLDEFAESRQKLAEVLATVVAPMQVVSVTVGASGELTDLKFPVEAYKNMAPAELASVILRTFQDAREGVLSETAKVLAPMLPEGFSAEDFRKGTTDLRPLM